MHWSRIMAIFAYVVVVAGVFLPWAEVGEQSVSGLTVEGVIPVVLLLPVFLLAFLGDRFSDIKGAIAAAVVFLGLFAGGYLGWQIYRLNAFAAELAQANEFVTLSEVSFEVGIWVQVGGCLLAAFSGVVWTRG